MKDNSYLIENQLNILLKKIINNEKFLENDYKILLQIIYHELVVDKEIAKKENQILINTILYCYNNTLKKQNEKEKIEKQAFSINNLLTKDLFNKIISPRNKTERSRK